MLISSNFNLVSYLLKKKICTTICVRLWYHSSNPPSPSFYSSIIIYLFILDMEKNWKRKKKKEVREETDRRRRRRRGKNIDEEEEEREKKNQTPPLFSRSSSSTSLSLLQQQQQQQHPTILNPTFIIVSVIFLSHHHPTDPSLAIPTHRRLDFDGQQLHRDQSQHPHQSLPSFPSSSDPTVHLSITFQCHQWDQINLSPNWSTNHTYPLTSAAANHLPPMPPSHKCHQQSSPVLWRFDKDKIRLSNID